MPRTKYPWDVLMRVEDDLPCGLPQQCSGIHAAIWELTIGDDFPLWMNRHNLQAAMHTKARHYDMRCHTAVQSDGLQVQFYRSTDGI